MRKESKAKSVAKNVVGQRKAKSAPRRWPGLKGRLMDSAYDVPGIHSHSRGLGHIPIIDVHPRGSVGKQKLTAENKARATINMKPSEAVRWSG